jgi:hypothetical protein
MAYSLFKSEAYGFLSSAMYGKMSAMYGMSSAMYGKMSAMCGKKDRPYLLGEFFVVGDVRDNMPILSSAMYGVSATKISSR